MLKAIFVLLFCKVDRELLFVVIVCIIDFYPIYIINFMIDYPFVLQIKIFKSNISIS